MFIENQLNFEFISYNPDPGGFTIEIILNKIFQLL